MVAKRANKKNEKFVHYWNCRRGDNRHGCFHADYDGRCVAHSKRGFTNYENCLKAAKAHRKNCPFKNNWRFGGSITVSIFKVDKRLRNGLRYVSSITLDL